MLKQTEMSLMRVKAMLLSGQGERLCDQGYSSSIYPIKPSPGILCDQEQLHAVLKSQTCMSSLYKQRLDLPLLADCRMVSLVISRVYHCNLRSIAAMLH
jgi:hypothetical protein